MASNLLAEQPAALQEDSAGGDSDGSNKTATPTTHENLWSIGGIHYGDRLIVSSKQGNIFGKLRYLGTTDFAAGQWAGVSLDKPLGKNDGAVNGIRYFSCNPQYGFFARIEKVSRLITNDMGPRCHCGAKSGCVKCRRNCMIPIRRQ